MSSSSPSRVLSSAMLYSLSAASRSPPHFLEKDGIVLQRIQVRRIAPQRQLVQSLRAVVVTLHVLKKLRVC